MLTYKKVLKKETYVHILSKSEASMLFKARTRMLNLKNNYKNHYKEDLLRPRCHQETDNEQHLFGECPELQT